MYMAEEASQRRPAAEVAKEVDPYVRKFVNDAVERRHDWLWAGPKTANRVSE